MIGFDVGRPHEAGGLEFAFFGGLGFTAFDDVQNVTQLAGVDVWNVGHPAKDLVRIFLRVCPDQVVFRVQRRQSVKFRMHRGQAAVLERDDELPPHGFTNREGRPAGVEAVHEQAERQAGEALLEARRRTAEGVQLAVLLGDVGGLVLDEFGHE